MGDTVCVEFKSKNYEEERQKFIDAWKDVPCHFCGDKSESFVIYGYHHSKSPIKKCEACDWKNDWRSTYSR